MLTLRWHDLVGRRVVDRDGKRLGKVVDLVARPQDEVPRVTSFLVGTRALIARVVQSRWVEHHQLRLEVPWQHVAELADPIVLSITRAEVRAVDREMDRQSWSS